MNPVSESRAQALIFIPFLDWNLFFWLIDLLKRYLLSACNTYTRCYSKHSEYSPELLFCSQNLNSSSGPPHEAGMDGQMDGWMDGWTDGWMDGLVDGVCLYVWVCVLAHSIFEQESPRIQDYLRRMSPERLVVQLPVEEMRYRESEETLW